MGGCRCTFRDCPNSSITSPGMHFFHFPVRDIERCEKWALYSNNLAFLQMPITQLRNKVVCEDHFRDPCFMNYKKERLTKMAVPTIMPLSDGHFIDYEVDSAKKTIYDSHGVSTSTRVLILNENLKQNAENMKQDFEFHIDNSLMIEKLEDEGGDVEIIIPNTPPPNSTEEIVSIADISPILTKEQLMLKSQRESSDMKVLPAKRQSSLDSNVVLTKIDLPRKRKKLINSRTTQIKSSQSIEKDIDESINHIFETANENMEDSTEKISIDEEALSDGDYTEIILQPSNIEYKRKLEELTAEEASKNNSTPLENAKKVLNPEQSSVTAKNNDIIQLLEMHKNLITEHKTSMQNIETAIQSDIIDTVTLEINQLKATTMELVNKLETFNRLRTDQIQSIHTASAVASKPIFIDRSPALNKIHLFNGIKKYLNPSMVALLRMEMFGGPERKYKPDEKIFAMELFKLNGAYEYMRDEWRFRLPSKSDIETWIKERDDQGCEVEWEEC